MVDPVVRGMRRSIPWPAFVVAFASGVVAALLILPFGLESSWAGPVAFVVGTLAAGLAAHLGSERPGSRLPVVLAFAFGGLVLALPLGALLVYLGLATLFTLALVVFGVVAAAANLGTQR